MAGKRTDINGRHPTRSGWVTEAGSPDLIGDIVDDLDRCLGRKRGQLSEDETLALSEMLWHWRGRKSASRRHSVSRQDQLRTLRGIASEIADAIVLSSYRQCDAKTRAEIQESLRKASEDRLPASAVGLSEAAISAFRQSLWRIFRSLEKEPDALRLAAQSAAERLAINPQQGGRPPSEYQRGFAEACLFIWEQMGGDPDAAIWYFDCSNPEPSPLLRFAGLLFDALEGTDGFDLTKVRRLLTEAREQGKVSPPS